MTTFARIAKILMGAIQPKNWIESIFASLGNTVKTILPAYTLEDENKVLTIDKVEDGTIATTIIQSQSITLSGTKKARLASDTFDYSGLSDGDTVIVSVGDNEYECTVETPSISDGENISITLSENSTVTYTSGTADATYIISAKKVETAYKAQPAWKDGGGGSGGELIVYQDENGVLDKTWQEIFDAIKHNTVSITADGEVVVDVFRKSLVFGCSEPINPGDSYLVGVFSFGKVGIDTFATNSANGYPAYLGE